jgi:uncharacterized membrane protein
MFYSAVRVGHSGVRRSSWAESQLAQDDPVAAALFGLITYGTYDLTNLATLKDWPALLSIVDMLWGTVLTVAVGCIGFVVGRRRT